MIIHLEVEWDDSVLERFALVIAQQSMHFALQLNWILQGALEDYRPDNIADGSPNENYSPLFYSRCLTLLKNVERVVVYGKPRAAELQRLYEQGQITQEEMKVLELADRRFNALEITSHANDVESSNALALDGEILVQMPVIVVKDHDDDKKKKKRADGPNEFVSRYCILEKSVLNCYMIPGGCASGGGVEPSPLKYNKESIKLDRAMSLDKATIGEPHASTFEIEIATPLYPFAIKCSSEQEAKLWYRRLQEEARASALFSTTKDETIKQDMTEAQLERYEFFQNEREFVSNLCQVAEDLREKDRAERKKLAPGLMKELEIPESVYLPLCNSTDLWRRVSNTLASETRVFNTKERCPVVMHFCSRRGETFKGKKVDPILDVAEYMHAHFEIAAEGKSSLEGVTEEEENEDRDDSSYHSAVGENDDNDPLSPDHEMNSSIHSASQVWEGEGEQMKRGTRMKNFLKDSVARLPNNLSKRMLMQRHGSVSVIDKQTALQPLVPILEGAKANEELENASVGGSIVSVDRSSIMVKDQVVFGNLGEGDITIEYIDRAKKYVSGGQVWAEKSAEMLEAARKEIGDMDGNFQLEISSCLTKSNDDLRQEVFIMQLIHYYKSVFAQAKLPLWLKTYRILSTSSSTGLLEFLVDATSIDGLKKSDGFPEEGGLRKYFEMVYDGPDSKAFKAAQTNFMQSLAGYAIVSYLLGLKDRHNGNIMIDTQGHLIFIDFGFAMGMAPGHEFSMERAPFKLTKEYVEVMGGVKSECFKEFERLFVAGFMEARKNYQIALGMVEIMMYKSNYPCFSGSRYGGGKALIGLEKRLMLNVPDRQIERRARKLIRKSKQHLGTYLYDVFQKATNGYAI